MIRFSWCFFEVVVTLAGNDVFLMEGDAIVMDGGAIVMEVDAIVMEVWAGRRRFGSENLLFLGKFWRKCHFCVFLPETVNVRNGSPIRMLGDEKVWVVWRRQENFHLKAAKERVWI